MILLQKLLRIGDFHGVSFQFSLPVPVGSQGSPIAPQLCELEGVSVGLALCIKSRSAPAEDRHALFFLAVQGNDGAPRYPFARPHFVGFEPDPAAPVGSTSPL